MLSQQSVESQAATLGSDYLSTGDAAFSADYTRRIQAVTAEQVRDVAQRYFTSDRMVVTRVTPPAAGAATLPAEARARPAPAEVFTLPNGLRVILQPLPAGGGRGLVAMAMVTEGGLLLEDEQTNGLGSVMMALSTKGAGHLSADEIAKAFHTISGECGNNTFFWQATVLDDQFLQALEVFGEVVLHPTFAPKELDILRPAQLAAIERVDQEWNSRLNKVFREQFFTGSPVRDAAGGRKDVVAAATAEQLAAHHRRCIKAGGSVLAICGQFDPACGPAGGGADLRRHAPRARGHAAAATAPRRAQRESRYVVTVPDQPVAGVIVARAGHEGLRRRRPPGHRRAGHDHQRLPAALRLAARRAARASAWSTWSTRTTGPGLRPGRSSPSRPASRPTPARVIAIIKDDLAKAASYLPTQQEVDEAVNVILTAEMLENQSAASLAMSSALDELYGLGYDWRRRMVAAVPRGHAAGGPRRRRQVPGRRDW